MYDNKFRKQRKIIIKPRIKLNHNIRITAKMKVGKEETKKVQRSTQVSSNNHPNLSSAPSFPTRPPLPVTL